MNPSVSAKEDFTLRRQRKAALRVWTWQDNPRITIRERCNASGGIGYRVTFPASVTGGRVLLLQSKDLEDAKVIARNRGREFRQSRSTALILGDTQKIQAATALRLLADHGINKPLDEVARLYAQAHDLLHPLNLDVHDGAKLLSDALRMAQPSGKPLAEVIDYAVKRLCPAGGNKTLSELTDEMVEMKRGWLQRGDLRPDSFRDFENRTGKIAGDLGTILLAELTKDVIYEWLRCLKLSPRSAKNYRMVFAEILKYAQQKRYIVANPIDELTRQDIKQIEGLGNQARQPAIVSPKQAEDLLKAAFKRTELDLGAAVVLGLFGGIRTEELKRLKWDAVRLAEKEPFVVIGPEIAKKRRIRNVPLPECAVVWLQQWPRTGDKVTRSTHTNDYQKRFKKLCAEAKIIWDSNAMRHSFGSYHFAKHANSIETARILGHKGDDTVLFAHYRALTTKTQADAYFAIMPATTGQVIAFPPAAAQ
jgi:integrase